MLILICIIVFALCGVVVKLSLGIVKGGLSVLGSTIEGVNNFIDPQVTDESAGPLIAQAAKNVAEEIFPEGDVCVIEFLPKEKSITSEVTSAEDIELIKCVKDKFNWEVTVLDKYRKTYYEGTIVFEIRGTRKKMPLQGVIYKDKEGRGGFAIASEEWEDYLKNTLPNEYFKETEVAEIISSTSIEDVNSSESIPNTQPARPLLTRDVLEQLTMPIIGAWKLIGKKENGHEGSFSPMPSYDVRYVEITDNDYICYYNHHTEGCKGRHSAKKTRQGYLLNNGNLFCLNGDSLWEHNEEEGMIYEYTKVDKVPSLEEINPKSAKRWKTIKQVYYVIMALFVLLAIFIAFDK